MSRKKGISFMAISKGTESKEIERTYVQGVGAVGVLAVNPTRAEQNTIFNSNSSNEEIVYVGEGTAKDANGNEVKVPQVRISLILKTDPAIACNNGIDMVIPVSMFLKKAYNYSNKNGVTKVQVIDTYGRTDWVTAEELKAHAVPEYPIKNGPRAGQTFSKIVKSYRPCFIGEEDVVKNIIAALNIPRPDTWSEADGTYVMKSDPKELRKSECFLDNIEKYFKGDVSELKEALGERKNNRYKLAFGVKTTANGTVYQCAYTRFPMKLNVKDFKTLQKELDNDKAAGRHPSEEYVAANLTEYKVTPTNYSSPASSGEGVDPFAATTVEDMPDFTSMGTGLPMDTDPFGAM